MPKSPEERYRPSEEEIRKAEETVTPEQVEMTARRERESVTLEELVSFGQGLDNCWQPYGAKLYEAMMEFGSSQKQGKIAATEKVLAVLDAIIAEDIKGERGDECLPWVEIASRYPDFLQKVALQLEASEWHHRFSIVLESLKEQ